MALAETPRPPQDAILATMTLLSTLPPLHLSPSNAASFSPVHRSPSSRLVRSVRLLIVLTTLLPWLTPLGAAAQDDELADLTVVPIDTTADPEAIMRLRPFIIGPNATASFSRDATPITLSESNGRLRLGELLDGRGVAPARRDEALDRYDDPEVRKIIPAPSLRVAMLMMAGWVPYEAVVAALLDGENPSRNPVDRIDFGPTDPAGAVATDVERDGRTVITVNEMYAAEPPEQLMPVLVHESLHGDQNSVEEEVAAHILDCVAYADVLLAFPDAASAGTELTAFNNATLLALLNSTGRGGPAQIGIEDALLGDVWLGPYLEEIDAASFRESVAGDEIYDGLVAGGSPGRQTLNALIARFPDASKLGPDPAFGDPLLTMIDRGIGDVVSPVQVVTLAETLGFDVIGGTTEGPVVVGLPPDPEIALSDRPFVPRDASLFDPRRAVIATRSIGEAEARVALTEALDRAKASGARRAATLHQFADPAIHRQISAPSLRSAALLLAGLRPWDNSLSAILQGGTTVIFDDLPYAVPVARQVSDDGHAIIIVNRDLKNEQPALLASYLVEGTLLPVSPARQPAGAGETVAAALLGVLAYGDLLTRTPELAAAATPATVQRNRELLTLLNSAGSGKPNDRVGFLGTASGDDVLPGLHDDASSFSDYIDHQRRLTGAADGTSRFTGSSLWGDYLAAAGISPDPGHQMTDREALALIDRHLSALLPPADLYEIAQSLDLGIPDPSDPGLSAAP